MRAWKPGQEPLDYLEAVGAALGVALGGVAGEKKRYRKGWKAARTRTRVAERQRTLVQAWGGVYLYP